MKKYLPVNVWLDNGEPSDRAVLRAISFTSEEEAVLNGSEIALTDQNQDFTGIVVSSDMTINHLNRLAQEVVTERAEERRHNETDCSI